MLAKTILPVEGHFEDHSIQNDSNRVAQNDRAFHDWYRFVLSFPPHVVSHYLNKFGASADSIILDPFAGTGTTLVESKKRGFTSIGLDANSIAHFASTVKTDWSLAPDRLLSVANEIADETRYELNAQGIHDSELFAELLDPAILFGEAKQALLSLTTEATDLLLKDSISPLPLHKSLVLLNRINLRQNEITYNHLRLAFAKASVNFFSNLKFGPEVGVGKIKSDSPVIDSWLSCIGAMVSDLRSVNGKSYPDARVLFADARELDKTIAPESVDIVITSPPYPNEKDYTRTTRLESVLLGFLKTKSDLRSLKNQLMRSNTRNVYKGDIDVEWITAFPKIQLLADKIEQRRIELDKTSGFERLYAQVTRLYFGGMIRHLTSLKSVLREGARLAYVVGDQASYFRVLIQTGGLIAEIAEQLGYEVESIDLFRTRLSTATKEQLREEIVVLRWSGDNAKQTLNPMAKKRTVYEPDPAGNTKEPPLKLLDSPQEANLKEYDQIIERIFRDVHGANPTSDMLPFTLKELRQISGDMGLVQENPPDISYVYRTGRSSLPQSILRHGNWAITGAGKGKYQFIKLKRSPYVTVPDDLKTIRILDSTPQIVLKYQGKDEQSTLAQVRYNRLVDVFTGLTTYHLQSHLRTAIKGLGQVEIDDLYIGIDSNGQGYILPVEAKSDTPHDQLGVVQITQMVKFARKNFPGLAVRPIGIKAFSGTLVFMEFTDTDDVNEVATSEYRRYQLYREK